LFLLDAFCSSPLVKLVTLPSAIFYVVVAVQFFMKKNYLNFKNIASSSSRLLPKTFRSINLKQFSKKSLYDFCLLQEINLDFFSRHRLHLNHAHQSDSPDAWAHEYLPIYDRLHPIRLAPTARTIACYSNQKHRTAVNAMPSIWQTKRVTKNPNLAIEVFDYLYNLTKNYFASSAFFHEAKFLTYVAAF
jgi:hypothetical protein